MAIFDCCLTVTAFENRYWMVMHTIYFEKDLICRSISILNSRFWIKKKDVVDLRGVFHKGRE